VTALERILDGEYRLLGDHLRLVVSEGVLQLLVPWLSKRVRGIRGLFIRVAPSVVVRGAGISFESGRRRCLGSVTCLA
jgi:hypothetical protein